jgi:FkbM family methyltransferase
MDELSLKSLNARIRLFDSSRTRKLVMSPYRLGSSRLLTALSRWRAKSIPVTARTFWGEEMTVLYPDGVSAALYQYGFFETGLTRMVMAYLKPGMTFFDVGAHFGYFTLLASHVVGDGGRVHSFEPTPTTFEVLRGNTVNRSNVRVNPLAVYSHDATLTFTSYELCPSYNTMGRGNVNDEIKRLSPSRQYQVQATSLDQYIAASGAKPDLIKLDAEGAEADIFKGMGHVLSTIRPMVTLEVGDMHADEVGKSRALVELFLSKGYEAWEYDPATQAAAAHTLRDRYDSDNLLLLPSRK